MSDQSEEDSRLRITNRFRGLGGAAFGAVFLFIFCAVCPVKIPPPTAGKIER